MKTFLKTLFFLSLFLITAFPQNIIRKGVIPDKLTTDRLREIHKSNAGGAQVFNNIEALLLKSKSSSWQTELRNHQREYYKRKGLDTKDRRTTINKTLLANGFLLIEAIYQTRDGSAWVNSSNVLYTYDANNNQTELLIQIWDGSAWVIIFKGTFTYAAVTAVNEDLSSVNSYNLSNNYPNPFNPSTRINFTISDRSNVSLKVFNLLGSEVAELVNGEIDAGSYNVDFTGSNLTSGVYFYQLKAGSFVETKKMLLLK